MENGIVRIELPQNIIEALADVACRYGQDTQAFCSEAILSSLTGGIEQLDDGDDQVIALCDLHGIWSLWKNDGADFKALLQSGQRTREDTVQSKHDVMAHWQNNPNTWQLSTGKPLDEEEVQRIVAEADVILDGCFDQEQSEQEGYCIAYWYCPKCSEEVSVEPDCQAIIECSCGCRYRVKDIMFMVQ